MANEQEEAQLATWQILCSKLQNAVCAAKYSKTVKRLKSFTLHRLLFFVFNYIHVCGAQMYIGATCTESLHPSTQ